MGSGPASPGGGEKKREGPEGVDVRRIAKAGNMGGGYN